MRFALLPLLLISACLNKPAATDSKHSILRVVTWNIHGHANGLDGIVDELRRLDADLICLQEVWEGPESADQATYIARELGMNQFPTGPILPDGREQKAAILYRGEIADPQVLDAGTGRIYGVAGTICRGTTHIRVMSIHLTCSYRFNLRHALDTSRARLTEAAHLSGLIREANIEMIVAGDFNCTPGMPDHDTIVRELKAVPTTQPTYPSDRPVLALDHIYTNKGLRPESSSVESSLASDHLPVLTTILIQESR